MPQPKQQKKPKTGVSLPQEQQAKPQVNYPAWVVLVAVPILALMSIPIYSYFYDFSAAAIGSFFLFFCWAGISITAGYHRLWAHRTYKASFIVQLFLAIGGTLSLQNSILFWASGHRTHHRHVDSVEQDPYSVKRGLWFSHMGWMLRDHRSATPDYRNASDLLANPLVAFQHKYYSLLALTLNVGIVALFGWAVGDLWGCVLLGGLLRIFATHQTTFFINSLAHYWGSQPYTDENTARDNPILAFFTWGEGYHNFHHIFQADYRNGVKWWQFDPTKWLILSLSWVGLTSQLKRIPSFSILRAEALMKLKTAQALSEQLGEICQKEKQALHNRLIQEKNELQNTINQWLKLKEQQFEAQRNALTLKLEQQLEIRKHAMAETLAQLNQLEKELLASMHAHREALATLVAQIKKHQPRNAVA